MSKFNISGNIVFDAGTSIFLFEPISTPKINIIRIFIEKPEKIIKFIVSSI